MGALSNPTVLFLINLRQTFPETFCRTPMRSQTNNLRYSSGGGTGRLSGHDPAGPPRCLASCVCSLGSEGGSL